MMVYYINHNCVQCVAIYSVFTASVCDHGDVRLFGGYTPQYGIAEVCINGHWADICSTGSSSSTNTIASTFCRQYTDGQ